MVPQSPQRKKRNSTKVNLIWSAVFHGLIVVTLLYFAAREGLLGKQLKKIAVEMVKEKKEEKPKEPEKPKEEPPKVETPKMVEAPKVEEPKVAQQAAPPPGQSSVVAPPAVAPPSVDVPSFVFEGGKPVETSSDPVQIYKSLLEYSLRSRWERPEDMDDHAFVAEVEVAVDSSGKISDPVWKKGSGNTRWDNTVKQALANARGVDRPPPAKFPSRVVVRFDVVAAEAVSP